MCAYGNCQIGIPKKGSTKYIDPGDTGFIAIHVFPHGKRGKGQVVFKLSNPKHPEQAETIKFMVEAE